MNTIIGVLVVLVTVFGGYAIEKGNFHILIQPVEMMIIFGAAGGAFIIQSPGSVLSLTIRGMRHVLFYKETGKAKYMDLLMLLYELLIKARKEGIISLESEIENVEKSPIFSGHPDILADKLLINFLRDNLRILVMGLPIEQIAEMMDIELESNKAEANIPAQNIAKVADALPGLGIVACVLGVVITMGKIAEPPEVLGHYIGIALVGTFMGVFSCYGFLAPMAASLEHLEKKREILFNIIRTVVLHMDQNPTFIMELARKEIPADMRPGFEEMESELKNRSSKKK